MSEKGGEGEDQYRSELAEEHCSALWNQIKDAGLLLDGAELSDAFLEHLQTEGDQLEAEVNELAQNPGKMLAMNAHLRARSVRTALEELKRKKAETDAEGQCHQLGGAGHFRRWLQHTETELEGIKLRIPTSRHNIALLRELGHKQEALQNQIEAEGRAKHQQLCNNHSQIRTSGKIGGEHQLEHRYLALWLNSLESRELIQHFVEQLQEEYPNNCWLSELENGLEEEEEQEGPHPKRRKTEEEEGAELEQYPENNNQLGEEIATPINYDSPKAPSRTVAMTDIGYSSGENTSVHDDGGTNTAGSEDQAVPEEQQQHQAEFVLTENNDLEKSFYRTVPLDEFGQTDLDTDEGGSWPRSSYWAQKLMDEAAEKNGGEKGGGIELTDSLIVHVDAPESREKLNDFEEVMDLIDGTTSPFNRSFPGAGAFTTSEDECESQSSAGEGRNRRGRGARKVSRKATSPPTTAQRPTKRKWATVRKTRSTMDAKTMLLKERTNGGGTEWPNFSSDFEWDDEEYGRIGEELRREKGEQKQHMLVARKKALRSFRDGLRAAAAQSDLVSVRLRELLTLVDASLGGVDSAAFVLAQLNAAFDALSHLCAQLERKMAAPEGSGGGAAGRRHPEEHFQQCIESELMLCHERMNALETTCNQLALLLGTHLSSGGKENENGNDYLAKFASECNRIREELHQLKTRFGEKFVFCSIQLNSNNNSVKEEEERRDPGERIGTAVDTSSQTGHSAISPVPSHHSFWPSYLLLCVIGLFASFGFLLFASSRQGTDWRWTFGPQLNYHNGAPPF